MMTISKFLNVLRKDVFHVASALQRLQPKSVTLMIPVMKNYRIPASTDTVDLAKRGASNLQMPEALAYFFIF